MEEIDKKVERDMTPKLIGETYLKNLMVKVSADYPMEYMSVSIVVRSLKLKQMLLSIKILRAVDV